MFSRIRSQFGTAGLVVAIVALVAALAGGAYAANGLSSGEKKLIKKESKKFSKQFSKKFAKQGSAGSAGAPGPAGPAGPVGPEGPEGEEGPAGEDGEDGEDGSPWVPDNELPAGATETGSWAFGESPTGAGSVHVPISFAVPLGAPLGNDEVHLIAANGEELILNGGFEIEEVAPDDCGGTALAPTAASGHLCVYIAQKSGETIMASNLISDAGASAPFSGSLEGSAGVAGARMYVIPEAASRSAWGTWAVTG